jgi:hypothetical protein
MKTITCFGYEVIFDEIDFWENAPVDTFSCKVCNHPYGEQWLDTTWLCDDCYQEGTFQLSRQHGYETEDTQS